MWGSFVVAVLAVVGLLYAPGFLFWRALGFSGPLALCCAPLFSVALYAALPVAYYELGVPCSALSVAAPTLLLATVAYLVARRRGEVSSVAGISLPRQEPMRVIGRDFDFDTAFLCLAVAIGTLVCLWVFVGNLPRADAFYSRYDNQTHLNLPQSFLQSGKWSTLHTSAFLASSPNQTPFGNVAGGFYPAAWHVLVALVCQCAGTVVTVSSNALVAVVCAVSFPSSLYLLVRVLLCENRRACAFGALLASASAVLPWVFLIKGPTYPEMLSHAFVPAVLAVVVLCVERRPVSRRADPLACTLAFAAFCAASFVGLAVMHPNSVFTCYVFLAAFGLHMVLAWTRGRPVAARAALAVLFSAAVVAVWYGCYQLSVLDGILSYHWGAVQPLFSSVATLGALSFSIGCEQPVLVLALLVGGVACLRRRWLWVLFPPLFFAVCYMASRLGLEELKYWLAALWYMTPYRFASKIIMFCLPIMALGADRVAAALEWLARNRLPEPVRARPKAFAGVVLALMLAYNYLPVTFYDLSPLYPPTNRIKPYEAAFGRVARRIHDIYTDDVEHVYSADEIAFVDEVVATIPEGALVINSPNDGSMWAYGVNGLNTYYRSKRCGGETAESRALRERLANLDADPDVRAAADHAQAQYVLQLDHGVAYADGVWIPQYGEGQTGMWAGIDAVGDDTPGFELVLAEGDELRLYRIRPAA